MASEIYMSIALPTVGKVTGSTGWSGDGTSSSAHSFNGVPVLSFNMDINNPRSRSGGRHSHTKIKARVGWGKWSEPLATAATKDETCKTVTFDISSSSTPKRYQWIRLNNATVIDLKISSGGAGLVQDITFAYQYVELGTGHSATSSDEHELKRVVSSYRNMRLCSSIVNSPAATARLLSLPPGGPR